MPFIARHCGQCKNFAEVEFTSNGKLQCPQCSSLWGEVSEVERVFESCPICQCKQFYRQKDFNQFLGCAVVLVGIILVPWTYGLSLPAVALLDWLLYRKVPFIVVCYRCASEFKGAGVPDGLKPFMHHIGMKYDKYRT